jgi:hypothetical protein
MLCYIILCYVMLYYVTLYYIILYYIILYYIMLHFSERIPVVRRHISVFTALPIGTQSIHVV